MPRGKDTSEDLQSQARSLMNYAEQVGSLGSSHQGPGENETDFAFPGVKPKWQSDPIVVSHLEIEGRKGGFVLFDNGITNSSIIVGVNGGVMASHAQPGPDNTHEITRDAEAIKRTRRDLQEIAKTARPKKRFRLF